MKSLSRNIPHRGVKFWNPILNATFSGSLLLFSRAFLNSSPYNCHLASLNLTKNHETGHFDSTLNLPAENPRVPHKISLPIRNSVDSVKNGTSDMPHISLESDSLGDQVVTPSLAPVARSNVINRSFSSRLHSNPQSQLRASNPNPDGAIDKIFDDSDARHLFDLGYDPLELEPFFPMEESGDSQIFALKVRLDPKYFSRAKIDKVETCRRRYSCAMLELFFS